MALQHAEQNETRLHRKVCGGVVLVPDPGAETVDVLGSSAFHDALKHLKASVSNLLSS